MNARTAKFGIGQVVKHRTYPFRGVIFDVDPTFANTEEWWRSIPAEVIVVEPTGAETELLVRVGTNDIVVVVHGRPNAAPGATVPLAIDPRAIHLFDPTSGKSLA